jgi:hypothetical protein
MGRHDVALYYPYAHIQDDAWLKAAALYWPKIGRIRPRGDDARSQFPRRDSRVARALIDATDLIIDVDPGHHKYEAANTFIERYLASPEDEARTLARWRLDRTDAQPVDPVRRPGHRTGREEIEWIQADSHPERWDSKAPASLVNALEARGIGVVREQGPSGWPWYWLGVHPDLARTYLTLLAQLIADDNGMPVVTDQVGPPGSPTAWTTHAVADDLLAQGLFPTYGRAEPTARELYAAVALNTVVPANLDRVPVRHIVKARTELAPHFRAFRDHLDELAAVFDELDTTRNAEVLLARVKQLANDKILQDVATLERELRDLRLEPVKATLRLKSFELPAVVAAAAHTLPHAQPLPVLLDAGVVSACFFTALAQTRRASREKRRGAAGYLLGLHDHFADTGLQP